MNRIKVVVVGDGAVGKTCLLVTFTTKQFPEDYIPTVYDNFEYTQLYEGELFTIVLWDTRGGEEIDRIRPLCYPQTDVFLTCYSINNRTSFENVKVKWVPEINHFVENVPFIIVATKSDLKYDSNPQQIDNQNFVEEEEGLEMAKSVGAFDFVEVSSRTYDNVDKVFDHIIELFKHKKPLLATEKKQKGCLIC